MSALSHLSTSHFGGTTPRSAEGDRENAGAMRMRARRIREAGSLTQALASGTLPRLVEVSLSEALVLALLNQGVRKYLAIFGHGSTDLGEVLRVYEDEGVTRTYNFRNEVAMAHAATALRWQYGELSAVVTSIGPGALQAMAGSLAAASNGIGVYHIYGDETTLGEGYNMQQVPKAEQDIFGRITALMGQSYVLHTPQALRAAMRRGSLCVNHPYRAGPFFLLMPLNTQPARASFNLAALPERAQLPAVAPVGPNLFEAAADAVARGRRVTIKAGGGSVGAAAQMCRLAQAAGAVVVLSPRASGVLPEADARNMHVGGSKGSISGNFAMQEADVLIAVGSRAVCQADCSGIGYPKVERVINVNGDIADANHYNHTIALTGDVRPVLDALSEALERRAASVRPGVADWLEACGAKKAEWRAFRDARYAAKPFFDPVWQRPVLGQPTAIDTVCTFAREVGAVKLFDAGDVQANGFQVTEDDSTGDTLTETGASYMGFAVSGLLASGLADRPRYTIAFTGDGSFMMNPQVLIDAVEHRTHGMVVIFDNRRMAAISSLQRAQYGQDFKTNDGVAVDYVQMASAVSGVLALHAGFSTETLREALARGHAHPGLSVLHVPVYAGEDALGGLGAWGSWNVGSWCDDVQDTWLRQDL